MNNEYYDHSTSLEIIDPNHLLWRDATNQVYLRYQQAFDARLCTFMPAFLALIQDGEIKSLCGFRIAQNEPLFLEQYLDQSADAILSDTFGCPISRSKLVEFGQLASFARGLSPLHFTLIAQRLVDLGFEWCIFTATDPLHVLMKRLGLAPTVIAQADPTRITDATTTWGSYYQHQPRILAGNLRLGLARLHSLNTQQRQA